MTDRLTVAEVERRRCPDCRADVGKPCVGWQPGDQLTNVPVILDVPCPARVAAAMLAVKPRP